MANDPRWACAGKPALTAQRAREIAARKRDKQGERVQAYRCKFCGKGWHVGHASKRIRKHGWG